MPHLTLLLSLLLLLTACKNQVAVQDQFLENYQQFCGYAYEGKATINKLASGALFENMRLVMILESCTENEVRIPFHVGEDHSRTWIVQKKNGALHLSHDHRYEDGTEHEANFYGGYADERGTIYTQYFPADEKTIENRAIRIINTWSKEFDMVERKYYYRLYQEGELRFEVVFDLKNPLELRN
ncbi:MAG: hypothetical protein EA362_01455 [Saprospirales bacterium]|nr:MAG: hypothetical protein EA362_01455 [Saprospirales bacterium]